MEASKLMEKVPGLRQKIAGKSIPVEVRTVYLLLHISLLKMVGLLSSEIRSPQVPIPRPASPPRPGARVPLPRDRTHPARDRRDQDAPGGREGPAEAG